MFPGNESVLNPHSDSEISGNTGAGDLQFCFCRALRPCRDHAMEILIPRIPTLRGTIDIEIENCLILFTSRFIYATLFLHLPKIFHFLFFLFF